tara:strand:- start:49 stop:348 length:300 start_codon:yes stop_codon:yes gene_type:complete
MPANSNIRWILKQDEIIVVFLSRLSRLQISSFGSVDPNKTGKCFLFQRKEIMGERGSGRSESWAAVILLPIFTGGHACHTTEHADHGFLMLESTAGGNL